MARGSTLGELVTQLRLAARYDPNPALSLNLMPLMQQMLKDTQERLYDEFDWPFMKIRRDKILAAGQRYYDIPEDMNLERILAVDIHYNGTWLPVERGISLNEYNSRDSAADEREDPACRWDVIDTGEGEQIEIWPIPASDGMLLRFSGICKLRPLVENSDRAQLDDQLIVLFAAGEIMGGAKNPEANVKFAQGKRRKETLQGRVTKRRSGGFVLGGGASTSGTAERTPLVAYVRDA